MDALSALHTNLEITRARHARLALSLLFGIIGLPAQTDDRILDAAVDVSVAAEL
jgi:hypothetical protein